MPAGFEFVFGWWGDSRTWPESPHGAPCIGEAVVGPAAFLDILETALGLGGPPVPQIKRIAAWQAKMRECQNERRTWSRSFEEDPWSTARLLLSWRDELIEAGWTSSIDSSPRLGDIAAVELAGSAVPDGVADRLRRVTRALDNGATVPISSVQLIDRFETLPCAWRRLLSSLKAIGVALSNVAELPLSRKPDLGFLQTGQPQGHRMCGDGSVNVIFADTELVAGECVASWLASKAPDNGTVIITGSPTGILDSYLADCGLPRLGASDRSALRGALQMLPLAFATAWEPFDPRPLFDLLLLPRPPLPRRVAREFAVVLRDQPGRGGTQWNRAWTFASDWLRKRADADAIDVEGRLAEWRAWIEPPRFEPEQGMPIDQLTAICIRVQQWALSRDRGMGDPILTRVAQASGDLAEATIALGLSIFPRSLLDRMIDQVIADGVHNPTGVAEASNWSVIDHPGALWGPVDRVIWWGLVEPSDLPRNQSWTNDELRILAANGCALDPPQTALERHSAAWRRGICAAQQQLVLSRGSGTTPPVHPIWHELHPRLDKAAVGIISSAEDMLETEKPVIATRSLARVGVRYTTLPQKRRQWLLSGAIPMPEVTSPTAIEDLLSCPLRWTLAHALRVRPGTLHRMSTEDQLLGNLAHAIAQAVFVKGAPLDPTIARSTAKQLFARFTAEIAAPLALPGFAAVQIEAQEQIPHAIGELARQMLQSGLTVQGCELQKTGEMLDGTVINGRIDLLTLDRHGNPVVFDLKWARREAIYRDKLKKGEAIQLGAYGQLVSPGRPAAAGYFLIRHAALIGSADGPFPVETKINGPDMSATWRATVEAWNSRQAPLRAGRVLAPGVALADGSVDADAVPSLSPEPPCHYCEYSGICGGARVDA